MSLTSGILNNKGLEYLTTDATGASTKNQKPSQPYIFDLVTLKALYFQGLPPSIDITPDTTYATLAAVNTNTPNYQFSNSEDTIKFLITWYAEEENKQDVLKKCKWLQALTKVDGTKGIHPVKFAFGELFKDSKFIVVSAPFSIRSYDREKGMMPNLASQELTLKVISSKVLSHRDYLTLTT